ncbi:NAD(P)/FAD-dependent oxidoreductase [Clostridium tepidiprofundi]|uniref:NAD(P)/FAD-dependent oxidoreductase n=1 Tax=Clostridium tepidiprofundi TaxID=420412 RepID=UPI0008371DDD|nr:NAD(P)/FAD-dependent oxidoreductase [Clostridium tepidiprofundi]
MKHELIIIGGGASGIISAITAKDMGIDVAILESTDRIGKKILSTGNGRCNISNINININRYHCNNKNFPEFVLNNFTVKDTINFFNTLGLHLITLDEGKMYPMSLQASSVLDIFRLSLEDKSIPVYTNSKVFEIAIKDSLFNLHTHDGNIFECKKLILCTGGKSYPKTGSDGSGYKLAKQLGHKIIDPIPSLVQIKLNYNKLKALSGIKFNGSVSIFINNTLIRKEYGEILFTDYGISGIPVFQLSRIASYHSLKNDNITLKVDLLPEFEYDKLKDFLENHWGTFGYRSIHNSFIGIINKKIIPILLKEAGINDIHKPCYDITWKEQNNILRLLKEWSFDVIGTKSFNNSQVTAGGVDTLEINPKTLESKIVKNLYFAGEILDVDGDCGGFNLQWAWSSGFIAAKSACHKN